LLKAKLISFRVNSGSEERAKVSLGETDFRNREKSFREQEADYRSSKGLGYTRAAQVRSPVSTPRVRRLAQKSKRIKSTSAGLI